MPVHAPDHRLSGSPGSIRRTALLVGVSGLALLAASLAAEAGSLRGRSGVNVATAATSAATAAAQAAASAASQALTRVNSSLRAMRDTQAAARAAAKAAASTVPNGLTAGGLVVAPGAVPSATDGGSGLWQGANLPTQTTTSSGRTQVEVKQNQQKAILTWESFNVGSSTDLYFNQTAGGADVANWIALNRVLDPTASPSKILGTIKAEGQVYIINGNGIIFGGSSQVNVNTLVATSLSLSNAQFMAGIGTTLTASGWGLGNDAAIALPTFGDYGGVPSTSRGTTRLYSSSSGYQPTEVAGDVVVEAGAVITTADGGKAMLFAPHVVNSGIISATNGQVILAAGEQVYLYESLDVRGFDVSVSAASPYLVPQSWVAQAYSDTVTGEQYRIVYDLETWMLDYMETRSATVGYSVVNNGIITSARGDITIQARDIVQNGALYASTALNNLGGSVRLQAWNQGGVLYSIDYDPVLQSLAAGTLTLKSGSVILVEPDLTDTSTIELTSLATRYEPGRVELRGYQITVESDAGVVVPAGSISVVASAQPTAPAEPDGSSGAADGSLIYIAENAYLSTAGLAGVTLSMESNVVAVELRIAELADSVLYQDSWLRGETIYVDKRASGVFTNGVMAGVEWVDGETGKWNGTPLANVSAWLGTSTTTLGEVSTVGGSIVLKSGGSVVTRAGSVLDVAGGAVTYTGGWVKTTKLIGADGRIYDIADATPDRVYVGFAGDKVITHEKWGVTEVYSSPLRRTGGHYEAGYTEGRVAGNIQIWAGEAFVLEGGYAGGTVVGERQAASGTSATAGKLTIGDPSNSNRRWIIDDLIITNSPVTLAADLSNFGQFWDAPTSTATAWISADNLSSSGMGTITFHVLSSFTLEEGTELVLAPGTALTINANAATNSGVEYVVDGSIRNAGGSVGFTGHIDTLSLGASSVIDVSGQWVNGLVDAARTSVPVIDGGSIDIAAGVVTAAAGARLDVSGGALVSGRSGSVTVEAGDAGSISLRTIDGASLANLDLRGYAGGSGGSLSITTAAAVQLGGDAPADGSIMYISGALYADRGFRSLTIDTTGSVTVPEGAVLSQVPVTVDLAGSRFYSAPTGSSITSIGTLTTLPLWRRADLAATELSVTADGDIVVTSGATVATDVGGSIELLTNAGTITVAGTLDAPAGSINLNSNSGEIVLTDSAALLARGLAVITTDSRGFRSGNVLDGGSVNLSAPTITMQGGALIDVSGASGVIDQVSGRTVTPVTLDSDGGSISITGGGVIRGRLFARAGGSNAVGGTLSVSALPDDGSGAFEQLKNLLWMFAYYGDTNGDGVEDWKDAIGIDYSADMGFSEPFIFTQELVDAFANAASPSTIVVSNTATTGSGGSAVDPTQYGLNADALNELASWGSEFDLYAIGQAMADLKSGPTLLASAVNNGGFANLNLSTEGQINLDAVNVTLAQSITLSGAVVNGTGTSSTLAAPYIQLNGNTTSSAADTLAGTLTLTASLIEVHNTNTIRGYAEAVLQSADISFTSALNPLTSKLTVDGDLVLKAAAIYPDTQVAATITAGNSITVQQNGTAVTPLSVAGSLTLEAPTIAQNGTLVAPFGAITLTADNLTLGAGSVTSVSGAGLTALYGTLLNGEQWQVGSGTATAITSLPEKKITLNGSTVSVSKGATVDISGGGDLLAWEFVAGTGGSHDVLAMSGMYAILPSQASAATSSGQRIWLDGGNGIAAGWYTLLPARYALLPGAYAIQLVDGSAGNAIAKSVTLTDGTVLMSGKLGNVYTGTSDALSSTVRIMSGEVVRSYSEYNEASANTYFASDAFKTTIYNLTGVQVATLRLPMDGGSVVFNAAQTLVLDGRLKAQGEGDGLSGLVDITGSKIAVVGTGASTADLSGYLLLDAASLTSFGGGLLIGGTRSEDTDGLHVTVTASDIVVRNDAASELSAPEVLLAATGSIIVADGSVVTADGATESSATLIVDPQSGTQDFGALIRVSSGGAVTVTRTNADSSVAAGTITIGASAVLRGRSVLIDATNAAGVTMAASASLIADNLSLASGRIGFGGGSGLVLDQASLAQLATAQNLTLRSYTTFDFYTGLDLSGLTTVTFDGAGLVGYGDGAIAITGNTIALANTGSDFTEPSGTGNGSLAITASDLILGTGAKALRGFATVTLTGTNGIVGEGAGSLDAGAAAVTLSTAVLTGRNAANQAVTTTGALRLVSTGGTTTLSVADSLGAIVSLTGGNVVVAGTIVAQGGAVNVTATGGALTLADETVIDVGAVSKTFYDVTEYGNAGTISLTAVGGDLLLASGARLDLAGGTDGGAAGTLSLTSSGGNVSLLGTIDAHAAAGETGGTFVLDTLTLASFSGLNQVLDNAGFTTSRQFRIRTGDVTLDGATVAKEFVLVADAGSVTITGSVDARTTYGGTISISAGNGLVMTSSAVLLAGATDTTDGLGSGRVTLEASGGALDIRGGTIDVSGGDGGEVRFRARQNATHDGVAVAHLNVGIVGSRSSVLEGVAVYDASATGTVEQVWSTAVGDAGTFMAAAPAIAGTISPGIAVMPGIEIRSSGDLTLSSDLDLYSTFASAREGGLTLRAAGNLTILGNISDGFSTATTAGALLDTTSWDLRLVAGADLGSASALTVTPLAALSAGKGTLTIGADDAGRVVRTGTGDIAIAAGRDIVFADVASSVYTAGRRDTTVYSDFTASTSAVYGIGGGNLTVAAGDNISVAIESDEGEFFTTWLKRSGTTSANASWWIDYGGFGQGVGVLGGGNIAVSAGGDMSNLVVALATTGRVHSTTGGEVLETDNGGAMTVTAGGAILGGQYYIARGTADITAASLGVGRQVTTYGTGVTTVYNLAPVLALGDATMTVTTAGDMLVQTVADPLLAYSPDFNVYMSGYTDRTAIDLLSVGGDITLVNSVDTVWSRNGVGSDFPVRDTDMSTNDSYYRSAVGDSANRYPAKTRITALNGSVTNQGFLSTMPSTSVELRILAADDIYVGAILMARATTTAIPSPFNPSTSTESLNRILLNGWNGSNYPGGNPDQLDLASDYEPSRIYALDGSIVGNVVNRVDSSVSGVTTSEQTWFIAGTDIRGVSDFRLRNNHTTDVSLLQAGNDISVGSAASNEDGITIQGSGSLVLAAGRNVSGNTPYIYSVGNRSWNFSYDNSATVGSAIKGLPEEGADITIMAGINATVAYDAFAAAYLDPTNVASMASWLTTTVNGVVVPLYLTDAYETSVGGATHQSRHGLVSFIEKITGEALSPLDAWARFQTLPALTQQQFIRSVYFQELRAAGRDQTGDLASGGYNRGYTAIETLFSGDSWSGDVTFKNALIRTMAGGDINVLTPGGGLQVASLNQAVESGYGLVTLGYGQINVFAEDDIVVNQSRVLTFAGGDITMWSTEGDIDAGRGAKTQRVPSAPVVDTDADGVTRVTERADISGSGIGTIEGYTGVEPGDVDLIAPLGTVNAGDAGIRVSGDFNVAARFVLNMDNVKVSGETKGIPKEDTKVAPLAVETKDKAAADAVADATRQGPAERPSVIIVEILGYGGPSGEDDGTPRRDEEDKNRRDRRSYNPNSAVQVVGAGTLTDEQRRRLIANGRL